MSEILGLIFGRAYIILEGFIIGILQYFNKSNSSFSLPCLQWNLVVLAANGPD